MAKIKITESELKEIISESVKGVLNEMENEIFGTLSRAVTKGGTADWNTLTPAQQQAYARTQTATNPAYAIKYGLSGNKPSVAGEHYKQVQDRRAARTQARADRTQAKADKLQARAQSYPQNRQQAQYGQGWNQPNVVPGSVQNNAPMRGTTTQNGTQQKAIPQAPNGNLVGRLN